MKRIGLSLIIAAAFLACGVRASADSWRLPTPQKYYSANREYFLEVIPREPESQLTGFFRYGAAKKEPAGSKPEVENSYCRGVFHRRKDDGRYEKVWERRLSNDVAPVNVLLSDGGQYVATFDNWQAVGMGDDVVVIYGPEGKLIKKLALSDIVPRVSNLPRTAGSIFWGGKHHIDERSLQLVLKVLSEWSPEYDEGKYREVRVDLRTGDFVKAKAVAD
jgi:hypothetical protein